MRAVKVVGLALLIAACGGQRAPTAPPSSAMAAVTDAGMAGPWDSGGPLDVEWLDNGRLVVIRGTGDPSRQRASRVDLGTMEATPLDLEVPKRCLSVDVQNPKVIGDRLYLDRRCFARDGDDRHEIMLISEGKQAEAVASIPWFPDSYVQLPSGAWLSGFDSGPCAWIDLVPDTGEPGIPWPITVSDDGEPFAVNGSAEGECDNAVLASSIDRSSDGHLAFVAAGAARSAAGFARLDVPQNVYVVPEAGGQPRRIASGLVEARNVRWSPDGSSLIVIARAGDGSVLLKLDLAGGQEVLYEGQPVVAAWAPDGRRIAIVVGNPTENRLLLAELAK